MRKEFHKALLKELYFGKHKEAHEDKARMDKTLENSNLKLFGAPMRIKLGPSILF